MRYRQSLLWTRWLKSSPFHGEDHEFESRREYKVSWKQVGRNCIPSTLNIGYRLGPGGGKQVVNPQDHFRRDGVIGSLATLKMWSQRWGAGSSPALGTKF